MKKVLIVTNIPSLYRKPLFRKLLKNTQHDIHIAFGFNIKGDIKQFTKKNLANNSDISKKIHLLKNLYIRNILVWQIGVLSQILKNDYSVIFLLGDFNCLSTWGAAVLCRLKGIKVVFWGHGLYGNEGKVKLLIRKTFYSLAHQFLLYERRAKNLMIQQGFKSYNLHIVFNSLDYDMHKKLRCIYSNYEKNKVFPFFDDPYLPVLVFIGRLTAVKKIDMLLEAGKKLNYKDVKVNILIIGEGPERLKLENIGWTGLRDNWLHFYGVCYSEEIIGKFLANSDLCISPGNVGLTAIHSLSFGTPVCTHNDFKNQMPEAEAIIDRFNGIFFNYNDVDDMVSKVREWLSKAQNKNQIRKQCYQTVDHYYNPYYQLHVFNKMIDEDNPEI